jgi:hypothetical protein
MNKGMVKTFCIAIFLLLPLAALAEGEIYKVVDKDGNITFTDQRPSSEAQPMDLPPLSVIETDIQRPAETEAAAEAEAAEPIPLTPRELRRKFRDFSITSPQPDETFWGTANSVVVTWGSAQPLESDMKVLLYVDGESREAPGSGSLTLTLERGEHKVYAELRDARNRRVLTTETVTFFVKQHSENFNRPVARPLPGRG